MIGIRTIKQLREIPQRKKDSKRKEKPQLTFNFDDIAIVSATLQDPTETTIEDAIYSGISSGVTNCADALLKAGMLAMHPSNTAGTTIVVFAGDGLCTDDLGNNITSAEVRMAADLLGATGAIVHSVAVGDLVDCDQGNHLIDIPQNGGTCTSVPDPHTLPKLIDSLIGTTLKSLESHISPVFCAIPGCSSPAPLVFPVSDICFDSL